MATRPQVTRSVFDVAGRHSNETGFDEGYRLGDTTGSGSDQVKGLFMDRPTRRAFGRDINLVIASYRKREGRRTRRYFRMSKFSPSLKLGQLVDDTLAKINDPDH